MSPRFRHPDDGIAFAPLMQAASGPASHCSCCTASKASGSFNAPAGRRQPFRSRPLDVLLLLGRSTVVLLSVISIGVQGFAVPSFRLTGGLFVFTFVGLFYNLAVLVGHVLLRNMFPEFSCVIGPGKSFARGRYHDGGSGATWRFRLPFSEIVDIAFAVYFFVVPAVIGTASSSPYWNVSHARHAAIIALPIATGVTIIATAMLPHFINISITTNIDTRDWANDEEQEVLMHPLGDETSKVLRLPSAAGDL